jgi:hypothetical protein
LFRLGVDVEVGDVPVGGHGVSVKLRAEGHDRLRFEERMRAAVGNGSAPNGAIVLDFHVKVRRMMMMTSGII